MIRRCEILSSFQLQVGLVAIALLSPVCAAAQVGDRTVPESAPPRDDPPGERHHDRVAFDGLIDLYAAYQLGGAGADILADRRFEEVVGGFALSYARLGLGVAPDPVGLRLDLGYGLVADQLAAATAVAQAAPEIEAIRQVAQAYVTFVPAASRLTVDAGKFLANVGAESVEANLNWTYTRSYLFNYGVPYTYTGMRLTFVPIPDLSVSALVVNGWDCVIDNNGAKTYGLVARYAATTGTSAVLTGLAGIETVGEAPPWRFLIDVIATQQLGRFVLAADVAAAREGTARWYGVAGYARVGIVEHLNVTLRGEMFVDHGGRIIANRNSRLEEVTLTAGVPIGRSAELRAEARADFADQPLFVVDTELKRHQAEFLAAALAWF